MSRLASLAGDGVLGAGVGSVLASAARSPATLVLVIALIVLFAAVLAVLSVIALAAVFANEPNKPVTAMIASYRGRGSGPSPP